MSRPRRILARTFTALIALLCLLSLTLWFTAALASYHFALRLAAEDDRFWCARDNPLDPSQFELISVAPWPHPKIVNVLHGHHPTYANTTLVALPALTHTLNIDLPGLSFTHWRGNVSSGQSPSLTTHPQPVACWRLRIAWWLLALIFSLPTATVLVRHLKTARHPLPSQCPTCGYDLRATPHRCPECGTIPPPQPT
jgi:hypothetical protein